MTICFPTAACNAMDFTTAAGLASRLGFDGVELHATFDPSIASATNALLAAPEKILALFAAANVSITSLNAGAAGGDLSRCIALASEFNCPLVRFECEELFSRSNAVAAGAVARIQQCADQAAAANITLLIENRPITGSAVAMWQVLDRIDHPAVACCWNTLSAFIAGDWPAVAVPTLNSRIQSVLLHDVPTSTQPSGLPLKEELRTGNAPIRKTLDRLRGIGFQGSLIVRPSTACSIDELQLSLQKSLDELRGWKIPIQSPASASTIP